ncbi:MAG: hypothetical protein Q4E10_04385, partial [Porphyromonas sp.]|nr:hypothetical protein [Porphyromonas sp.]
NLEQAAGLSVSLSDAACGYYMGLDRLNQQPVSIPIEVEWSKTGCTAEGASTAYGMVPDRRHQLTLYVVMQDGKGYMYTFDVTSEVQSQEGNPVITVVVDEVINLPEAEPQGGGNWQVEVEEWTDVYLDIKM